MSACSAWCIHRISEAPDSKTPESKQCLNRSLQVGMSPQLRQPWAILWYLLSHYIAPLHMHSMVDAQILWVLRMITMPQICLYAHFGPFIFHKKITYIGFSCHTCRWDWVEGLLGQCFENNSTLRLAYRLSPATSAESLRSCSKFPFPIF